MRLLVTGGCGFIGSNFIRYILQHYGTEMVTNVDVLTYAGNLANLAGVAEQFGERYEFYKADIANAEQMNALMAKHQFYAVINFAAESHVDRSIDSPQNFIHSNVVGTSILLDAARRHGVRRFVQISTDEVYGSLGAEGKFTEESPIQPSSPYSASKAGADLLVNGHAAAELVLVTLGFRAHQEIVGLDRLVHEIQGFVFVLGLVHGASVTSPGRAWQYDQRRPRASA